MIAWKKYFIACCFLLLTTTSYADAVSEFLAHQTVIRVSGDNGEGYGNLATTIDVMNRVRVLGFKGVYEVVYSARYKNDIIKLFNLSETIPDVYTDTTHHIQFIQYDAFLKQSPSDVTLGIAGPVEYLHDADFNKNVADALHVNLFANITNDMQKSYDYIIQKNTSEPILIDEDNTYLPEPNPSLAELKQFLADNPTGQTLQTQKPALLPFINGLEQQQFLMMPVYGFTIHDYIYNPTKNSYLGNMLQILLGVRYAMQHGPADLQAKALIIPIFYDYEKEAQQLMTLLHSTQWGEFEVAGAAEARQAIQELNLAAVVSTANLSDPTTALRMQQLRPGDILLLSMGPLPKIAFDSLYTYTSDNTLPPVREGLGTLSHLLLTGKAHFRCYTEWDLGFGLVTNATLKTQLVNFYENFCRGMTTWQMQADTYKQLGDLIMASRDPHSTFSQYFETLQAEAAKPENDRVYHKLSAVVALLEQQKGKS